MSIYRDNAGPDIGEEKDRTAYVCGEWQEDGESGESRFVHIETFYSQEDADEWIATRRSFFAILKSPDGVPE